MKLWLLNFLLVTSCAHTHLDRFDSLTKSFDVSYNFTVYTQPGVYVTKEEIETVIDQTIFVLLEKEIYTDKQIAKALRYANAYDIVVVEEEFTCMDVIKCPGEFLPGTPLEKRGSIAYVHSGCIAYSVLAHELLHFFDHLIDNRRDTMHKNSELFKTGCLWRFPKPSIETVIDKNIKNRERCMSDTAEVMITKAVFGLICR